MNEKTFKVSGLTKELLADLDKLFPEKTPDKHGYEGNIFSYRSKKVLFASYTNKKRNKIIT